MCTEYTTVFIILYAILTYIQVFLWCEGVFYHIIGAHRTSDILHFIAVMILYMFACFDVFDVLFTCIDLVFNTLSVMTK